MARFHHYDNLNTARFVTVSCYRRQQLLTDITRITILLEEIDHARTKHAFRLFGYVIMPEHIHLVLHPQEGAKLGSIIGEIKSKSARRVFDCMRDSGIPIPKSLMVSRDGVTRPAFWQRRCYDHNCRTRETTIEKIAYCHNNPVKRNLVKAPEEWRWSSAGWYAGVREAPLRIDELESFAQTS